MQASKVWYGHEKKIKEMERDYMLRIAMTHYNELKFQTYA